MELALLETLESPEEHVSCLELKMTVIEPAIARKKSVRLIQSI